MCFVFAIGRWPILVVISKKRTLNDDSFGCNFIDFSLVLQLFYKCTWRCGLKIKENLTDPKREGQFRLQKGVSESVISSKQHEVACIENRFFENIDMHKKNLRDPKSETQPIWLKKLSVRSPFDFDLVDFSLVLEHLCSCNWSCCWKIEESRINE